MHILCSNPYDYSDYIDGNANTLPPKVLRLICIKGSYKGTWTDSFLFFSCVLFPYGLTLLVSPLSRHGHTGPTTAQTVGLLHSAGKSAVLIRTAGDGQLIHLQVLQKVVMATPGLLKGLSGSTLDA